MKTETIVRHIYQFDKLGDDAKRKALDWYREGATDYEWWDFIYDDAKAIAKLMGIEIDDIYVIIATQVAWRYPPATLNMAPIGNTKTMIPL